MFICCPKCEARYQISDEVQLPETQKFKCSACGAVFEQPVRMHTLKERELLAESPVSQEKVMPDSVEVGDETPSVEQPNLSRLSADAADLGMIKRQTEGENDKTDSLPEAFIPVTASKRVVWGRGIMWLFVFLFVAVAGTFLYYKPAARWLESAVNRFTKDMMPAVGFYEESSHVVPVKERSKPKMRVTKGALPGEMGQEKQNVSKASVPTSVVSGKEKEEMPSVQPQVDVPPVVVPAADVAGQIKIRGVTFRPETMADGTQKLVVEGMVFNLSDKRVALPSLAVRFENATGDVIQSGEIQLSDSETAPKHAQSFSGVFPAVSDVVRVAVVLK